MSDRATPDPRTIDASWPYRLQYGEMGYLLPKGDTVFKAFVDQWLHLAKASGEFGRIYDQFVK